MNPDYLDLLRASIGREVRFLIAGAYALALHGRPRATGDLDVRVESTSDNAVRVVRAPGVALQLGVAQGFAGTQPRVTTASSAVRNGSCDSR